MIADAKRLKSDSTLSHIWKGVAKTIAKFHFVSQSTSQKLLKYSDKDIHSTLQN
jgi:hypothetical protein